MRPNGSMLITFSALDFCSCSETRLFIGVFMGVSITSRGLHSISSVALVLTSYVSPSVCLVIWGSWV